MFCLIILTIFLGLVPRGFTASKNPPVYDLPSYVKHPCYRNDPKLDECVVDVGNDAIKAVVKGDPKYRIPKLSPLEIRELRIQQGTKQVGLELLCSNCLMHGLENTRMVKSKINWDTRSCRWDFKLDQMKVTGKYNVSGQVLLLPITGNGDLEMFLSDMSFSYDYDWTYKMKNGYQYVVLGKSSFPFDVNNMSIHLDHLFNGDKLLGDNMNRFINENWREIIKDLKPALSQALSDLTKTILGNMAALIPYDKMYPIKK